MIQSKCVDQKEQPKTESSAPEKGKRKLELRPITISSKPGAKARNTIEV